MDPEDAQEPAAGAPDGRGTRRAARRGFARDKGDAALNAIRARLRAMGDAMSMPMAEGDEAAEDAMLDKLAAMVAEMKAAGRRGREDRGGRHRLGRAASKDDLVALILSDHAASTASFPRSPKPARSRPRATQAPAVRPCSLAMHRPRAAGDEVDESTEAYALAERMINEKKAPDFATAITLASREVRTAPRP